MTAQKVLEDRELRNTRAKANLMLHEQSKAEMDLEQEGFDEPGAAMRLLKGAATEDGAKMEEEYGAWVSSKDPHGMEAEDNVAADGDEPHEDADHPDEDDDQEPLDDAEAPGGAEEVRMRKRPPGTRMNGRTKAPKGSRQAAKASGGPTNRGGRSRAGAAKKAVAVAARDRAKASLTIGEVSIVMEDIEPATVTFSRASDLFQGCG